ncbi:hypothetical protein F5876DRAFT_73344 [Lentinula aff. lateritia]|uniref:Uncharacterized protein n=1 Tax=Lentinula aff. lateritia TaxID=2804960 RepID=A0ACC1UBT1_9AGAR|nr:hypothetical protein F5876DRAFT_73344 [Lentinula aff. lateritia]
MLSNDSDDEVSQFPESSSQSEDQKRLLDVPKAFYGDPKSSNMEISLLEPPGPKAILKRVKHCSRSRELLKNSDNKKEIQNWFELGSGKLDRVDLLVPDLYGVAFLIEIVASPSRTTLVPTLTRMEYSISSSPSQVPPSVHLARRLAAAPPVENVFVEKFSVVLPNKTVTFTMADISEFPKVKMPRSPQPYLQKLLSFWDDDLQTWDALICPLVGGTRIAAKHWKIIFSKAGHWKVSTNRTQWHTWRTLIEELQKFDNCPEQLCKKYHNSIIRDIATASRK